MALDAPGQWVTVRRRWSAWVTLMVLVLWAPVSNATTFPTRTLQTRAGPIAGGVDLRVLPIGDSITWGAQSSDSNGYRKELFNKLANRGNKIDFVGGTKSGDMSDPDHEGHRGFEIAGITGASALGIYAAPNIVLLHAGTNNMKTQENADRAPADLRDLIDLIFEHSKDAVVFVCQIIPSTTASYQARVEAFNALIPGLVDDYVASGKKVVMVSMNQALTTADMADNLHPNDGGYIKMANAYYAAIESADARGWISAPGTASDPPPDATAPENCKSTPSWYRVGQIADGAKVATTDGDFKPSWSLPRVIADGACPRDRLHFMDLDGDGLKDYACVDPTNGATDVWLNIPDADGKSANKWNKLGQIATGRDGRDGTGVMFADLNGDGRDDYIYVDPSTGNVFAWINQLSNAGVWQWQELGAISVGVGATNETLQMADIDGDGRADFCLVDLETGAVTAWLNTGAGLMLDYHKIGVIATGATATVNDKVFLGDFTGEGRADYMLVGKSGKSVAFINRLQEDSHVPLWPLPFTFAEGPDGAEQDAVRLVDMTGDGKVDYLLVDKDGRVRLWENNGTGGKYQEGEGVILCDLDGDGTSDYFWLDHTGKGWGYLNTGKGKNLWNDLGQIAYGDHKREQVRMAVLTKSGRADYTVVDDDTGRAVWFENLGEDGQWGWRARGVFAEGPVNTLKNNFGWTLKGKNVRFADLDGDGLDDYLYVHDNGAVVMWRHLGTNPPTWSLPHLVADGPGVVTGGPGVLAQEVQFADTNGDGLLDYVAVDRVNGAVQSWHHLGFRDDGSIRWNTPLSFADGMTGDQRADYVSINPDTGRLRLWHNRCWPVDNDGGGGTGPDPVETPDWRALDCSAEGVNDASADAVWRWNKLLCPEAWSDAIKNYTTSMDRMSFSREIGNFFNGPDQMECGNLLPENQCYRTIRCDNQDPGPAAFMILNSFAMVSSTLKNMKDILQTAATDIDSNVGDFSDLFAPVLDEGVDILVILDILALGYGGVMAPIWNKWVKNWDWSKRNPDDYDTAKDFANDMTYQGISLAKDLIATDPRAVENELRKQIGAITAAWRTSIVSFAEQLFNGSSSSRSRLGKVIASGKMVGVDSPANVNDLLTDMKKSLYALLVPVAWRLSGKDLNPFIIDTGLSCADAPGDDDLNLRLEDDTREKKLFCDTKADRGYYLVGAVNPKENCRHDSNTGGYGCDRFQDLPGADQLTGMDPDQMTSGEGWWRLLSVEDIILGSVATFKKNGNKNVKGYTSYSSWDSLEDWDETLKDLADGDIRSPYFINLPVCRVNEALYNYFYDNGRPFYYPCNQVIDWEGTGFHGE